MQNLAFALTRVPDRTARGRMPGAKHNSALSAFQEVGQEARLGRRLNENSRCGSLPSLTSVPAPRLGTIPRKLPHFYDPAGAFAQTARPAAPARLPARWQTPTQLA